METEDIERLLLNALESWDDMFEESDDVSGVTSVLTFEQAGVLTRDRGIVLRMLDKSEFQISIVRSR